MQAQDHPAKAARLFLLFFGLGLLAARAGVLVHEFAGHGLAARLLGVGIRDWSFSLFGGAWVGYGSPPGPGPGLLLDLSGTLANLFFGAVLLLLAGRLRPGGLPRMVLLSAAVLSALAGGVYLVRGLHYGYGDGRLLHLVLEAPFRGALVAALSFALTAGAAALALAFFRQLRAWLPGEDRKRTFLLFALCGGAAAGLYGSLYLAERTLAPDRTWEALMEHESGRQARVAVDRMVRERVADGRPAPTRAELEGLLREEEGKQAPFPLDALLFPGLALAVVLGFLATKPAPDGPGLPGWDRIWLLLSCGGTALAAILFLRLW